MRVHCLQPFAAEPRNEEGEGLHCSMMQLAGLDILLGLGVRVYVWLELLVLDGVGLMVHVGVQELVLVRVPETWWHKKRDSPVADIPPQC